MIYESRLLSSILVQPIRYIRKLVQDQHTYVRVRPLRFRRCHGSRGHGLQRSHLSQPCGIYSRQRPWAWRLIMTTRRSAVRLWRGRQSRTTELHRFCRFPRRQARSYHHCRRRSRVTCRAACANCSWGCLCYVIHGIGLRMRSVMQQGTGIARRSRRPENSHLSINVVNAVTGAAPDDASSPLAVMMPR